MWQVQEVWLLEIFNQNLKKKGFRAKGKIILMEMKKVYTVCSVIIFI